MKQGGSAGAGTTKTLEKLEKSVNAGNYYEAQQMYKTIYARYVAAKKYVEALDLLESGASLQLKHGQVTCGVELGLLFVDTLRLSGVKHDGSNLERIKGIANKFPREDRQQINMQKSAEASLGAKTRVEGYCTFIRAAIKWSIDRGGPRRGSPELHGLIAEYIISQSPNPDLAKASMHFVRSGKPDKFATALISYAESEQDSADLAVAQGVLLYLSLGNLRDANRLVNEVEKGIDKNILATPLMQFVKYLRLTLERDALPLFRMLLEKYKTYIARDESFSEYLDAIAEKFYGVQHKNGLQRMLGDFMKQMFVAGSSN